MRDEAVLYQNVPTTELFMTNTAIGLIDHLMWRGILLPVKVQRDPFVKAGEARWKPRTNREGKPYPLTDEDGRLIFALPGGGEFISTMRSADVRRKVLV